MLIAGFVTWHFLPEGEAKLMARAEKLMESDYAMDWRVAKETCLKPLVERFPEGRYSEKAHQMMIDIDKRTVDKEMHSTKRLKQGPANEAEKQYLSAEHFLKFGDRITALRKFRSITQFFKDNEEFHVYVLLAQDEVDALIKAGGADEDYVAYLNRKLKEADGLFKRGNVSEAEEIWQNVKTLYRDNEEVRPHVTYATKRINREEPGPAPWAESGETQ